MPAVRRSRSGQPATASVQDEDTYLTVDRSEFIGRRVIEQLAKGDDVSMLDIVQRHREVPFYLGDIEAEERDVLDILRRLGVTYVIQTTLLQQGTKEPSVYARANVEVTRTIIDAAVAAGVRRLVYTSSAEKSFDAYNDAQETFGSRDSQVISDNNNLFDYTYVGNVVRVRLSAGDRLVPPPSYSPTTSSPEVQGACERLREATRTQIITERWSFEATESSRRRRNIEDSCAELTSSSFHFGFKTSYLHLRYSRRNRFLR
ncbi:hypothetical protein M404DRAFT_29292 [Pisolithus tinctorius Marx 270]|uniref:3-beta hydroxysteroid dehydrogenase/isomerase domain-containing protein n=1 Tax=Pisolithus tinctorius Marx 270 TaxID=870435 RepID=A0A0C3NHU6_PISTI|nr:hypothetical protein M404DRAFT_29292 [Pisolithus tinctorius Marx 270]